MDAAKNAHDGGSLNGNGAGGAINIGTVTYDVSGGATETDVFGDQVYSVGAGCPLCFSRNSVKKSQKQSDSRIVQKMLSGF